MGDQQMSDHQMGDQQLTSWLNAFGAEAQAWGGAVPGSTSVDSVMSTIARAPREVFDPRVSLPALARQVCPSDVDYEAVEQQYAGGPLADPQQRAGAAVVLWMAGDAERSGGVRPAASGWSGDRLWLRAALTLAVRVAPYAPPREWVTDAARREEAARWILLSWGSIPADELPQHARARLEALDSLRHSTAASAAKEAYEHRLRVATELAELRAREAAQRYTHE